jgi:hypothetical protein
VYPSTTVDVQCSAKLQCFHLCYATQERQAAALQAATAALALARSIAATAAAARAARAPTTAAAAAVAVAPAVAPPLRNFSSGASVSTVGSSTAVHRPRVATAGAAASTAIRHRAVQRVQRAVASVAAPSCSSGESADCCSSIDDASIAKRNNSNSAAAHRAWLLTEQRLRKQPLQAVRYSTYF